MKIYKLDVRELFCDYSIGSLYSKGHHEKDVFLTDCKEFIGEAYKNKIYFIEKTYTKKWAKNVAEFENGERVGSFFTFKNERPEKYQGWFPITIIDVKLKTNKEMFEEKINKKKSNNA